MGETFIDLYVSCPAASCSNTQITYWVHSTDSGKMEISNRARLRCG
ncbi:15741_t:CDS:1, partial [Racocetra fulgida]